MGSIIYFGCVDKFNDVNETVYNDGFQWHAMNVKLCVFNGVCDIYCFVESWLSNVYMFELICIDCMIRELCMN